MHLAGLKVVLLKINVYAILDIQDIQVLTITLNSLKLNLDPHFPDLNKCVPERECPSNQKPDTECGPNEHWVECDYCTEHDCKWGMACAKKNPDWAESCLIENQCVCDAGYSRYTGAHVVRKHIIHML